MSLEQWFQNKWLQRSETSVVEIQKLFQIVDRELSDAQATGLSVDGCFEHAYVAALQLCMIALRATGYDVVKREGPHKRAIDSLSYTLGSGWSGVVDQLDYCRKCRGQTVYDQIGVVSQEDASALLKTTKQLRSDVIAWLKVNHRKLVPANL